MNLSAIENKPLFRGLIWKRNGYLLLGLLLQFMVLYFLASLRIDLHDTEAEGVRLLGYVISLRPFHWFTLGWIGVFLATQVVLAQWAFAASLESEGMISLHPEDKSERKSFGGLSGGQVVKMTQDLAKEFGLPPVSRIIISEKPEPNAYTTHVFGLWSVVVLHSNLLEVLPREGVRAVIAHELGHLRRWDTMIYLFVRLPAVFAWVVAVLAFGKMISGLFFADNVAVFLARLLFVMLALFVTAWVFMVLRNVLNLAVQKSELLADAYAAQAVGWESHLNALLLIGERAQALTALTKALQTLPARVEAEMSEKALLRLLNRFPPRELDENVARDMAPVVFIKDRLDLLRTELGVPLSEEEIENLAIHGAHAFQKKLAKEEAEAAEKDGKPEAEGEKKRLADWRAFDTDRSGHLDPAEVAALVKQLRDNPGQMLFRQFLAPEMRWQSHPTMRDRVLSLYDLFQSDPGTKTLFTVRGE